MIPARGIPDRDELGAEIAAALDAFSSGSERSQQSANYQTGISDLGHCRQKLTYLIRQTPPTDPRTYRAAFIGTALGDHMEQALFKAWPDAVLKMAVNVRLLDSLDVGGHPDIVLQRGAVLDGKSVDGVAAVEREGPSTQQRYQLHLYMAALLQMGYFRDIPRKDLWVSDFWIDRSGKEARIITHPEAYDPEVVKEAEAWIEDVIYAVRNGEEASRDMPREFCQSWCLAGDTEVVTRQGIRRIGELAGQDVELLVPAKHGDGLTWHGHWETHPVRSFGTQLLQRIELRRGRATMTVRATAEHQWFLRDSKSTTITTAELRPGDILRSIRANNSGGLEPVLFAQAQGFIFGDGDDSGVTLYGAGRKASLAGRLFHGHRTTLSHEGDTRVNGTPSLWKELPDLRESKSFLLSWLSGYFAADGSVSSGGHVISSADRVALEYVRSVCSIVGIGYGTITTEMRKGTGAEETPLYRLVLRRGDLPDWFLLLPHHRAFVSEMGAPRTTHRDWKVVSVTPDAEEEVFCAVVPKVQAFALANGLLTHNCEWFSLCRGADSNVTGMIEDPRMIGAARMYDDGRKMVKAGEKLLDEAKGVILVDGPNGLPEVEGNVAMEDGTLMSLRAKFTNRGKRGFWTVDLTKAGRPTVRKGRRAAIEEPPPEPSDPFPLQEHGYEGDG